VTAPGGFADPSLPAGYAPFGIQNVNGDLFVTFAKQNPPDNRDEVDGPGLGVVDVFDPDGNLMRRFASAGRLNAPWGIALAPDNFGAFSGDLLIGNFGDGTIDAYDLASGAFVGRMVLSNGQAIVLPGLWGIAFGPGVMSQPKNALFFAAGINDEANGLYGRIDPPTM
jgi:uncharacterized protein (TIGR03118 family)